MTFKKRFAQTAFKSGWREIGGKRIYARSTYDANFARYLQFQKEQGRIKEWAYEPQTFRFEGITRGCTTYKPDFGVVEIDGSTTIYEIKGYMDQKSGTKIKRMRKYFPNVNFIVIEAKEYRKMMKGMPDLIPDWEA